MKAARIRNNNKKEEIKVTEEYSVKQMVITIVILLAVFGIFYLITVLVVNNNTKDNTEEPTAVIDSSKITVGHILDRKEDEYYVLATKSMSNYISMNYEKIYNNYLSDYSKLENALAVYKVDLDDALNKNYTGEHTNITDNLGELKLSEDTLFKINNGKIENYYVGNTDIIEVLSSLKKS